MIFRRFKKLFSMKKGSYAILCLQCLCTAIYLGTSMILIDFLGDMVNEISAQNKEAFIALLIKAAIVAACCMVTMYAKQKLLIHLQSEIAAKLRSRMITAQINASFAAKEEQNSGKVLTTYQDQMDVIIGYMQYLPCYIINPLTIAAASLYFITIHPVLFLASVIMMPLSSVLYQKLSCPIQELRKKLVKQKETLSNLTQDTLEGFSTLKAYQLQSYFDQSYEAHLQDILATEKKIEHTNATLGRVFIIIRYIPQLVIPLFGGYLAYRGDITIGELMAASMISAYIFNPLQELLNMKKQSRFLAPALNDVDTILSMQQEANNSNGESNRSAQTKKLVPNSEEVLTMKNFSFAYPDGKQVIDNLQLSLLRNEHLVIIGESGSGKSTVMKAICGMLNKYQGEIRINGKLESTESIDQVRSAISYIPQTIFLFQGSIMENIALSDNYDAENVYRAARLSGADEFIQKLPKGYETIVGDGGFQLSGGQQQRIAIARGIYRNCELFLLDEPTAAIDEKNEQAIMSGLRSVLKDKSSIIITHRMDIVASDDRVMQLEGGRLHEA